jgi:hypothetical protein
MSRQLFLLLTRSPNLRIALLTFAWVLALVMLQRYRLSVHWENGGVELTPASTKAGAP